MWNKINVVKQLKQIVNDNFIMRIITPTLHKRFLIKMRLKRAKNLNQKERD